MDDLVPLLTEAERRWGGRRRGPDLFAKLMEQDERLVAKGFPPMTKWWKRVLGDFYRSGKRRLVCRVGRKGTKSAHMCRVAVNEVLNGDHILRPGDMGLFMFMSENVTEANGRIFTIKAILDALGVSYEPLARDLRVTGRPLAFGVRAARVGAVSGPIVIGFVADEEAKWSDDDTGANPATEVLSSVRPATVTQPNAHEFHISSPWADLDAHYDMMAMGNTEEQAVAEAPSWVANPTITEEFTRTLEPDEASWKREYAAIPMGSGTQHWFDSSAIKGAVRPALVLPVPPQPGVVVNAGGDFGFISDHAALGITHRVGDWETARYSVAGLYRIAPTTGPLKPKHVVGEFASRLKWHQCSAVMADGHYKMSIIEHLDESELGFLDAPASPADAFVRFRVLLNGSRMDLPQDEVLLAQLRSVMWRPTPNGGISIILPRKPGQGHCDLVSAVVLAPFSRGGDEIQPEPQVVARDPMHQAQIERWQRKKEADEQGQNWFSRRFQ